MIPTISDLLISYFKHGCVRIGGRDHWTRRMVGVGDQRGCGLFRDAGGLHGCVLGFDRRTDSLMSMLMEIVLENLLKINVSLMNICKSANA